MIFEGASLDDLLFDIYTYILDQGKTNRATKGKNLEVLSCQIVLTNPLARVSRSESRGLIFSCLGELLWYLSGTNDGQQIIHYLPKYQTFCEPDGRVHGGYGSRLFNMHEKYNQIERVIEQLKYHSGTRKAVIQLFDSSDLSWKFKDIPCTLNLQFVVRENKLHMFTMMRSNDAFIGLPHDIFVFTMIQELIAGEINCELGNYYHYVVSLHLYETDIMRARDFIDEGFMLTDSVMDEMPKGSFFRDKNIILDFEYKIRNGFPINLENINLDVYWIDILKLILFFTQTKSNKISDLKNAHYTKKSISNIKYKTLIDKRVRTYLEGKNNGL
ncbi:thymidylate synthase [Xenorhabdus vietnamensis]|uniref:Thymidylate synthase n=1 Tax=Xenorhabdus vietnamensis TaxID=351656 RepID=A0A1Y2SH22_9GAMM|nr:thymidylate synthase [Xenorhabdus vietnamensis]OTA17660.1 thymidylate synthase [Xenorhabdus vietnamensis]